MIAPEVQERLDALSAFVRAYDPRGKTRRQFWREFAAAAGDLPVIALADGANMRLHLRYCEILAEAIEAGYVVAESRLDEVIARADDVPSQPGDGSGPGAQRASPARAGSASAEGLPPGGAPQPA